MAWWIKSEMNGNSAKNTLLYGWKFLVHFSSKKLFDRSKLIRFHLLQIDDNIIRFDLKEIPCPLTLLRRKLGLFLNDFQLSVGQQPEITG